MQLTSAAALAILAYTSAVFAHSADVEHSLYARNAYQDAHDIYAREAFVEPDEDGYGDLYERDAFAEPDEDDELGGLYAREAKAEAEADIEAEAELFRREAEAEADGMGIHPVGSPIVISSVMSFKANRDISVTPTLLATRMASTCVTPKLTVRRPPNGDFTLVTLRRPRHHRQSVASTPAIRQGYHRAFPRPRRGVSIRACHRLFRACPTRLEACLSHRQA